MNIDRDELSDIVALLDDGDTVVAECIDRRLKSFGPSVVRSLIYCAASERAPKTKSAIEDKASRLNTEFRLADLQKLLETRQRGISLFEGSFIICSLMDYRLQRQTYEDLFFKCSAQYVGEVSDQRTGVENVEIFNHIFFNRLGFTLYDVELGRSEYSLVSDVLRSRKGNPFALALIYIMMARDAGIPLGALCFPGGFLPVYIENGRELFYVNVFRGGDIIIKDNLLRSIKVTGIDLKMDSFKIQDEAAILGIYTESLLIARSRHGETRATASLEKALSLFGPTRYLSADPDDSE